MYKQIFTLMLVIITLVGASGASVAAQTTRGDENQTVSKQIETNRETFREALSRSKESSPAVVPDEKDTMDSFQKQRALGKKLSTKSKVLIGVGIAAAAIGIAFAVWASREK